MGVSPRLRRATRWWTCSAGRCARRPTRSEMVTCRSGSCGPFPRRAVPPRPAPRAPPRYRPRPCRGNPRKSRHVPSSCSHFYQSIAGLPTRGSRSPLVPSGREGRTRSHRIRRSLQNSLNVRKAAGSFRRAWPARDPQYGSPSYGAAGAVDQGTFGHGGKSARAKSANFRQFRRQSGGSRDNSLFMCDPSQLLSTSAIRPCSSAVGLGGHPGMCRSTGTTSFTPPTQA